MYIGSRRSHAQHEAMEYIYRGLVRHIKEGFMIIVLADGYPNGYPFLVAKVINVFTENEDVKGVEVHWYATTIDTMNGVYNPEMVVDKKCWKQKSEG